MFLFTNQNINSSEIKLSQKKKQKVNPMPTRRKPVQSYYKVDYKKGTISRSNKFCPRCKGSFLAKHKDRASCGLCGYTEF
ncbi:MAG: 30S ribosomal protein S27ae [Candidatus Hodarchaeales archaeon]